MFSDGGSSSLGNTALTVVSEVPILAECVYRHPGSVGVVPCSRAGPLVTAYDRGRRPVRLSEGTAPAGAHTHLPRRLLTYRRLPGSQVMGLPSSTGPCQQVIWSGRVAHGRLIARHKFRHHDRHLPGLSSNHKKGTNYNFSVHELFLFPDSFLIRSLMFVRSADR